MIRFKNKNITFKDAGILLIIVFLYLIICIFSSSLKKVVNINSLGIKKIELYNYVENAVPKKMIIEDKDGIRKVLKLLNSLKKTSKKQKKKRNVKNEEQEKNMYENTIDINDINNYLIIVISYKKSAKKELIIKVSQEKIIIRKKDKEKAYDVDNNKVQSLWYILNYKILNATKEEIKKVK